MKTHSYLYCLKPIGVGTHLVESLTSYLVRLSNAHCISEEMLTYDLLLPMLYNVNNWKYIHTNTQRINGDSGFTKDIVKVLELLTMRQDLYYLTMLTWSDVLSKMKMFRHHKAWCPRCFEEWKNAKELIYEPLLWSFWDVSLCYIHNQKLMINCFNCNSKIPHLNRSSRQGYCPRCKQWLGIPINHELISNKLDDREYKWQIWVAKSIGELLSAAPLLKKSPRRELFSKNLNIIVEIYFDGKESTLASKCQISEIVIRNMMQGKITQLNYLLKLCYFLSINPLKILTSNDII